MYFSRASPLFIHNAITHRYLDSMLTSTAKALLLISQIRKGGLNDAGIEVSPSATPMPLQLSFLRDIVLWPAVAGTLR